MSRGASLADEKRDLKRRLQDDIEKGVGQIKEVVEESIVGSPINPKHDFGKKRGLNKAAFHNNINKNQVSLFLEINVYLLGGRVYF